MESRKVKHTEKLVWFSHFSRNFQRAQTFNGCGITEMNQPGIISRRIIAFTAWIVEVFIKVTTTQVAQITFARFHLLQIHSTCDVRISDKACPNNESWW